MCGCISPCYRPPKLPWFLCVPLQVALWLVCKTAPDNSSLALPLAAFGLHLFLGNWWNVVFFGQHRLKESIRWMGAFWVSIAGERGGRG